MTLVMNTPINSDTLQEDFHPNSESNGHKDELTIVQESKFHHLSAMPEDQRRKKQENAPSMVELFEQTMKENGQHDHSKIRWTGDRIVEAEDVSKMSIHNFILQAEALGKDITYTKQTIISIS